MDENTTNIEESIGGSLAEVLEAEGETEANEDVTPDEDVEESGEGDAEITEEDWTVKWEESKRAGRPDPSVMPPAVRRVYDDLLSGAHRVMSKADLEKKEYERRIKELESRSQEDEPEFDASTDESLRASTEALADRRAKKIADERLSPLERQQAELAQKMRELDAQRRYEALTKREGVTPEVLEYMDKMSEKRAWQAAIAADPDGALDEMTQIAIAHINTTKAKAEAKRATEAKKAAAKRPSSGAKAADGQPDLGSTMEEIIANTFKMAAEA